MKPPTAISLSVSSYGTEEKVRLLFLGLDLRKEADRDKLSQREKFIWVIEWCHTELQNGGTDQVFYNSTGGSIPQIIDAFETIGAPGSAAILRQAGRLFPEGQPSTDQETRREQMAIIRNKDENAFDHFDGKWFQEEVCRLLLDYWKKHEPPADQVPESKKWRSEALRLAVDLPIVNEDDYDKLTDRERCLWDISFFAALAEGRGNVSNFFVSPEGEHALALLTALEKIGATNTAAIVRKVCSFYPIGWPSSDVLERMRQSIPMMDKTMVAFSDVEICDGVVKHDGQEEDLFALLLRYWKAQE